MPVLRFGSPAGHATPLPRSGGDSHDRAASSVARPNEASQGESQTGPVALPIPGGRSARSGHRRAGLDAPRRRRGTPIVGPCAALRTVAGRGHDRHMAAVNANSAFRLVLRRLLESKPSSSELGFARCRRSQNHAYPAGSTTKSRRGQVRLDADPVLSRPSCLENERLAPTLADVIRGPASWNEVPAVSERSQGRSRPLPAADRVRLHARATPGIQRCAGRPR